MLSFGVSLRFLATSMSVLLCFLVFLSFLYCIFLFAFVVSVSVFVSLLLPCSRLCCLFVRLMFVSVLVVSCFREVFFVCLFRVSVCACLFVLSYVRVCVKSSHVFPFKLSCRQTNVTSKATWRQV